MFVVAYPLFPEVAKESLLMMIPRKDGVRKFAEILVSVVLAGELSLASAISSSDRSSNLMLDCCVVGEQQEHVCCV